MFWVRSRSNLGYTLSISINPWQKSFIITLFQLVVNSELPPTTTPKDLPPMRASELCTNSSLLLSTARCKWFKIQTTLWRSACREHSGRAAEAGDKSAAAGHGGELAGRCQEEAASAELRAVDQSRTHLQRPRQLLHRHGQLQPQLLQPRPQR